MFGLSERPLQTRQGLLFSFSAYLQFLSAAFLRVETHWFSPPWIGRCPGFVHNCPTRLQRGGEPASLVSFPTWLSKPHTGPHRGEFGSHRFFLGCFGSGSAAKSRSSLQFTASWVGRMVNCSVPFLTSPLLVLTLVGSTLMSCFSSN